MQNPYQSPEHQPKPAQRNADGTLYLCVTVSAFLVFGSCLMVCAAAMYGFLIGQVSLEALLIWGVMAAAIAKAQQLAYFERRADYNVVIGFTAFTVGMLLLADCVLGAAVLGTGLDMPTHSASWKGILIYLLLAAPPIFVGVSMLRWASALQGISDETAADAEIEPHVTQSQ